MTGGSPDPAALGLAAWRRCFPALEQRPHGRRLAYLDSASTALKPQAGIDAVLRVFTHGDRVGPRREGRGEAGTGRAIVKGTGDASVARRLVGDWLGVKLPAPE